MAVSESTKNTSIVWSIGAVAVALGFLYFAVLAKLGSDWWTEDDYSHGLLVPFIIGYIIWLGFDEIGKIAQKPMFWTGGAVVIFALFLLLLGVLGAELFAQRISFFLMLAGVALYLWGWRLLHFLAVPFLLLLLAIPIPNIIFNKIAFPLQLLASKFAIAGIKLLDVPSLRQGNVIEILPRGSMQSIQLEVVEACSGIRSLMTLVTLALLLGYFTRSGKKGNAEIFYKDFDFWRIAILMVSAVPIAIITNAARVTATGVLTYYYGRSAAEGFSHNVAGWLVYLAALLLLLALNWVLVFGYKRFSARKEAAA